MPLTIRTLKDGYWDLTTLVRATDGMLRVRKESRETANPGPWAHEALRNEISYLQNLPDPAKPYFPPLLDCWDDRTIGYEIPFYSDRPDLARLMLEKRLDPKALEEVQDELALAVLSGLHSSGECDGNDFCIHLKSVIEESIEHLTQINEFRELIEDDSLVLNDQDIPGIRHSFELLGNSGAWERLAAQPSVQIHGDLILENMLWSPILLIDPVSVAGLTHGNPLFDLVKHESYARGELYAIREDLVRAERLEDRIYLLEIPWTYEALEPFLEGDMTSRFRDHFVRHHGEIDLSLYNLIDGYFSLVMARNTTGLHQYARVLKGCQCLATAGNPQD